MTTLLTMDAIGPADRARVGGKAWALAALHRRGVSVPPAVVVPVDALEQFLRDNGLWERAASRADPGLQADILRGRLDPELAGALRTGAARLGSQLVVRSSGVDEDGEADSFAGQYQTVLGVAPGDETESAILQCWASAWSERAVAYRTQRGIDGPPEMAVLIQPLVVPRCAGVMFTINPLTGSWREMTVEAAWGLPSSALRMRPRHWSICRTAAK